jgi:hypothetical protein
MKRNLVILVCLVFCGFLSTLHADANFDFSGATINWYNGTVNLTPSIPVGQPGNISANGDIVSSVSGVGIDFSGGDNFVDYNVTFATWDSSNTTAEYASSIFSTNTDTNGIDDAASAAEGLQGIFNANGQIVAVDLSTSGDYFFNVFVLAGPNEDAYITTPGDGGIGTWDENDSAPYDGNPGTPLSLNGLTGEYAIFTQAPVSAPEPNSLILSGTGLGLLLAFGTMRRRKLSSQSSL